jgi:uncharacterized paraquat-inducible protein A
MIEVSWAHFFLIYLISLLFSLFALWLFTHFKKRKKRHSLPEKVITLCEYCQTLYSKRGEDKLSRCPVCRSVNHQISQTTSD